MHDFPQTGDAAVRARHERQNGHQLLRDAQRDDVSGVQYRQIRGRVPRLLTVQSHRKISTYGYVKFVVLLSSARDIIPHSSTFCGEYGKGVVPFATKSTFVYLNRTSAKH